MRRLTKNGVTLAALAALAGCATQRGFTEDSNLQHKAKSISEQRQLAPAMTLPNARVEETPGAYIPLTPRKSSDTGWLREKKVDIAVGSQPVPLAEILRVLSRQGLNITSELALDRFTYSGFDMRNIEAETALRVVLSASGLDYYADANKELVTVRPMASRTWYLNIGNRSSSYVSGGAAAISSGSSNGSGSSSSNSSGAQSGMTNATGSSKISSSDNFWGSLKEELEARLKVMLPEPPARPTVATAAPTLSIPALVPGVQVPGLPPSLPLPGAAPAAGNQPGQQRGANGANAQPATAGSPQMVTPQVAAAPAAPAAALSGGSLTFTSRQVGGYSINPETGAITVQAPHWVLNDLDVYMKRVQEMYNTDIVFQGELVMVSADSTRTEGLDITSFARFASGRYGIVFKNNALGGVTLSVPPGAGLPSVSAPNAPIQGPLLGLSNSFDGLQLFNAYLSNLGRVTSLQKPVLTTTSGVPADFRRTVTRYFNSVSQETSGGGSGSAAVGTRNTLVPQEFGTILRVNPRIDVATGLIRAQIELVQTTQQGTQTVQQSLSAGDSVEQVPTQVPILSRILYSGEALLRDGDLIVMGGQTQDNEQNTRSGITGMMDSSSVGGLFGQSNLTSSRDVFYFALRVSVNKRQ